jgi:predicted nucleic acid-binding protein
MATPRKKGQTPNFSDVMIAATALHNGVALRPEAVEDVPRRASGAGFRYCESH